METDVEMDGGASPERISNQLDSQHRTHLKPTPVVLVLPVATSIVLRLKGVEAGTGISAGALSVALSKPWRLHRAGSQ